MLDTLNTVIRYSSLMSRAKSNPLRATRNGTTLIEVMLAVAIIVIASLGTLCYEYLCVHHIHFARAQLSAARTGQLLLEDWKSTGGSADSRQSKSAFVFCKFRGFCKESPPPPPIIGRWSC